MSKALSFTAALLASLFTFAQEWKQNSVQITSDSKMQKYIDQAITEIFQSPLQKPLCQVFKNQESLSHSLGVTSSAATQIFANCPSQNYSLGISKTMQKKYFLSAERKADIESWTDFGNRTFIFVDENTSYEEFKRILTHELSISFDAKTNMYYTTYLRYQVPDDSSSPTRVITFGNLAPEQDALRDSFNKANWAPISNTFSAMRAFALESIVEGKRMTLRHDECVSLFQTLYPTSKSFENYNQSTSFDQITLELATLTSNSNTPRNEAQEKQFLNQILDSQLTLQDQGSEVTFCQYMARPLLTGRTTYNFFGNGPRPRLTGGSGGQGTEEKTKAYIFQQQKSDVTRMIEGYQQQNQIFQKNLRETINLSQPQKFIPSKE